MSGFEEVAEEVDALGRVLLDAADGIEAKDTPPAEIERMVRRWMDALGDIEGLVRNL